MTSAEFKTQIRDFFRLDTKLSDDLLDGFFEEIKQSILFELMKSDNIKALPVTINKQVAYTASNTSTVTPDKILWLSDMAVFVSATDKHVLNTAEEQEIVMNLDEETFPRRFNRISDQVISLDSTVTGTLQIECILSPTSTDLIASLDSFDGQIMEMGRAKTSNYLNLYRKGGKK